jgi:hypothetical protein
LDRLTEKITIKSVDQIPTIDNIRTIPRDRTLKLIFDGTVQKYREEIGQNLKNELFEFKVSIHTSEPLIHITKLISDKEIEDNKAFFEECAKDYRQLGEELIFKLIDKLNVPLNTKFPLITFNEFKQGRQSGKLDEWKYFIHGFHCGFEHLKTGQSVEVPLVFGLEFGDLDPYFFSDFIKSTQKYKPLPVEIFENYADGERIIEKMLSLGLFEKIGSNITNYFGIAVTDRKKVEIEIYKDENDIKVQPTFNLWKWLRLK